MVLEEHSRLDAARQAGMDRQTLRDWVHRYNEAGAEGLVSRPMSGVAPKLTRLQPRPHYPKKAPATEEAFKKTSVPF